MQYFCTQSLPTCPCSPMAKSKNHTSHNQSVRPTKPDSTVSFGVVTDFLRGRSSKLIGMGSRNPNVCAGCLRKGCGCFCLPCTTLTPLCSPADGPKVPPESAPSQAQAAGDEKVILSFAPTSSSSVGMLHYTRVAVLW